MANRTWKGTGSTGNDYDWSVAGNWEEGVVPTTGDDVRIPAGSAKITSGLDQSAIGLGDFYISFGFDQNIGTSTGYLQLDPNRFDVSPIGGAQYLHIASTTAIDVQVQRTGSAASGYSAVNLTGLIDDLSITQGSVGVARLHGETATVENCRVLKSGARVRIGAGTSIQVIRQSAGTVEVHAATSTVNQYGGSLTTNEDNVVSTLNIYGGRAVLNSIGTMAKVNHYGGAVDLTQSAEPRTITGYQLHNEDTTTLSYDPNVVTLTTFTLPARPVQIVARNV